MASDESMKAAGRLVPTEHRPDYVANEIDIAEALDAFAEQAVERYKRDRNVHSMLKRWWGKADRKQ